MKLMILILNKDEYFEKIVSLMVESSITGATIFDSQGIGSFLAYEIPIFAGLRSFIGEAKTANKSIMAVLDNDKDFVSFKKLLAEEGVDFNDPGVGVLMTIKLDEVVKAKY